jgi:hypothetical protein
MHNVMAIEPEMQLRLLKCIQEGTQGRYSTTQARSRRMMLL